MSCGRGFESRQLHNLIIMNEIMFLKLFSNILIILFFLCLVFGYLFGSIPVGYLYCKKFNVNILKFGSGNPGSTNVGRALGKKHGRIVFFLDILKVILPILIIRFIFFKFIFSNMLIKYDDISISSNKLLSYTKFFNDYISIYAGLGAIIGHNYPIFLKFKGGKGISCTMGAIFSVSIIYSILLYFVYKITSKISNYVSVGSLLALTVLFFSSIFLSLYNLYPFKYADSVKYGVFLLPGIFIMTMLGFIRHKNNIKNLISGTELKINQNDQ